MLLDARREATAAGNTDPNWRFREPSDAEFQRFTTLVHDVAGIALNDSKRALVSRRLNARLRDLRIDTLGEYTDLVRADESGAEIVTLLDLIATNETHFFREKPHFDYLESRVFPGWIEAANSGARSRVIRAWSAACSTGQEPYSLAMQLLAFFPPQNGWTLEIEATDISTHVLEVARRGEWSIDKAREIPQRYLDRYMLRGTGPRIGRMRACPELRHAVRFTRLNLNDERYAMHGTFDLIFCRNVLIYFSAERRAAVIERLTDRLTADGLLFVGHAESLHAHRSRLKAMLPTVYSRAA